MHPPWGPTEAKPRVENPSDLAGPRGRPRGPKLLGLTEPAGASTISALGAPLGAL